MSTLSRGYRKKRGKRPMSMKKRGGKSAMSMRKRGGKRAISMRKRGIGGASSFDDTEKTGILLMPVNKHEGTFLSVSDIDDSQKALYNILSLREVE